tara:strand:- start:2113 stop:3402 length:1290 start_codon:yes stop_codon:yes gene_type:complete
MSAWKEEDEYEEKGEKESALPKGVLTRINSYAERTGMNVEDATTKFLNYIEKEYGCTNPDEEDDDLLEDWSEQAFIQTRKEKKGTTNLSNWVGCFLGIDPKKKDRLANIVNYYTREYKKDPEGTIGTGRIGVYEDDDGAWSLRTSNGVTQLDEPSNSNPPYAFKVGKEWLCLTTKAGKPSPNVRMGRYAYFLGGEENDFVSNGAIELWRVDITGGQVDLNLNIGRPCKIPVIPPKDDAKDFFKTVLSTYADFEPIYTDEFVGENLRPLLQPSKFWVNPEFHNMYSPIDDLEEAFESGKESGKIEGERKTWGPLVITKGTVVSMSTERRETEFDPDGYNYSMTLSSSITGDVDCWIPGAVGDITKPFHCGWGDDTREYAELSTVFAFGRLGMKDRDGMLSPKMTVFGVYADPRRVRQRVSGGNTGVGQFD